LRTIRLDKLSKRDFSQRLSSNTFWTASLRSNRIDPKESENFKSASLTRKSLFKEESKDKERIRRLLRQLPMKTKIRVSLR